MKHNYMSKKCLEYFEIIEQDGCMILKTDTRTFKNGGNINCFWTVNKDYCYNKICELKDIYPIAYDILSNVYKYGYRYMTIEEKCKCYLQKTEELGYLIDINTSLQFSDGSKMSSFIRYHGNEIKKYILDNKNHYLLSSFIILPYIDSQQVFLKKCQNFFSVIDHTKRMIDSRCKVCFDDGALMKYFWYKNYEKIHQIINYDVYRVLYPIANSIINQYYDVKIKKLDDKNNYLKKKKMNNPPRLKMTFEEKSDIIIDFMESNNRLINYSDKEIFINKTKYHSFWVHNRDRIKNYFKLEKDKSLYPNVNILFDPVSKIKKAKLLTFNQKLKELIILLSSRKDSPYIDNFDKFSDGTNVYNFWYRFNNKICQSVMSYDLIDETVREFMRPLVIKRRDKLDNKIMEYIELVEHYNSLLTTNKDITFKDSTSVFNFWYSYKLIIALKFCDENIRQKYPLSTKLIQRHFYKRAYLRIKLDEYLSLVELYGNLLTNSNITFDDEIKVKTFMRYHKDYILKEIELGQYKEKYPKAYDIIKNKQKVKKL